MVADIDLSDVISELGEAETQDFAASSTGPSNHERGNLSSRRHAGFS
jgi:hypothetical protein